MPEITSRQIPTHQATAPGVGAARAERGGASHAQAERGGGLTLQDAPLLAPRSSLVIAALFLSNRGGGRQSSIRRAGNDRGGLRGGRERSGRRVFAGQADSARDNGYYRSSNPVRCSTKRRVARLSHYQMGKIVTLKGPLRATVSRDGVTLANSNAVLAGTGPCAAPLRPSKAVS
jgi:hypothetical protein